MRIAIVDDLAAERTLLKGRLEWQLQRRNVQADILEYESGETFLEAARKAPFTAAFLDIYMDGMTGMEAAKKLRKTDTDCLLVFITTSTDHALEGFQVRALHYLVKPFTEADIDSLTDELLARIPQPDKYIYGAKGGGKRNPSALSGHRLCRTLRPLDLRPYDGSKDACHTPTLQDVHRPTKG